MATLAACSGSTPPRAFGAAFNGRLGWSPPTSLDRMPRRLLTWRHILSADNEAGRTLLADGTLAAMTANVLKPAAKRRRVAGSGTGAGGGGGGGKIGELKPGMASGHPSSTPGVQYR